MTDYTFMQQIFYKIVYDEYIIDNIIFKKSKIIVFVEMEDSQIIKILNS